jgi:hypothetical protein
MGRTAAHPSSYLNPQEPYWNPSPYLFPCNAAALLPPQKCWPPSSRACCPALPRPRLASAALLRLFRVPSSSPASDERVRQHVPNNLCKLPAPTSTVPYLLHLLRECPRPLDELPFVFVFPFSLIGLPALDAVLTPSSLSASVNLCWTSSSSYCCFKSCVATPSSSAPLLYRAWTQAARP